MSDLDALWAEAEAARDQVTVAGQAMTAARKAYDATCREWDAARERETLTYQAWVKVKLAEKPAPEERP